MHERACSTCTCILGLNALGLRSRMFSIALLLAVSCMVLFMQLAQLHPAQ